MGMTITCPLNVTCALVPRGVIMFVFPGIVLNFVSHILFSYVLLTEIITKHKLVISSEGLKHEINT